MRATIFFLTFVVFAATVVWRVDQVMFGDKLAWGEAQSRAQMSALARALEIETQSLRDILLLSFTEVELGKKDFSASRPYGEFQMMSKLLAPNLKDDRKDWQVVSTYFQQGSPVKKWAAPYITLALKSVREAQIRSNTANVYALMDPSRRPYLLLLARGGANWYAGLLGVEAFQGLMDRQKGQKSTVFVVNTQGQALGHTTQEYIGSLLTEDPLVTELIKNSVGSGFGIFRDLKGESVQGLYEQIENTNLYAVITTPVQALTANRGQVRWQLILMGAGLGLIGLAFFVFSDREGEGRGGRPVAPPPLVAPAAPVPASVSSVNVPSGVEKMKAYTQVASSLSHELRSPLTSILGHTQLVINQVSDNQTLGHLHKIEEEARGAREIVQKLLIFSGEDKVPTQKMGLETVLNKALKHVEGKILFKGIKLTKNIQSVPQFTMAGDLVAKAVENLLLNAIEAMERAPKKELGVSLVSVGSTIELKIVDTGEGISQNDLGKIFDPFFTTRSGSHHVGLGLSTALGIFKEAFGEVHVDSEKGQGTTVKVVFKPQESLLNEAAPSELPKRASAKAAEPLMPPPPPTAAKKAPETVAAEVAKEVAQMPEISPLLVDNTIERLIEGELPDMPPLPQELQASEEPAKQVEEEKLLFDSATLEPLTPPSETKSPEKSEKTEKTISFSAKIDKPKAEKPKIDKPKIEIKKKASRLDEVQVAVRRPGERV